MRDFFIFLYISLLVFLSHSFSLSLSVSLSLSLSLPLSPSLSVYLFLYSFHLIFFLGINSWSKRLSEVRKLKIMFSTEILIFLVYFRVIYSVILFYFYKAKPCQICILFVHHLASVAFLLSFSF